MNLEAEILREHSKHQAERITAWIGNDRKKFKQLMDLFLRGEYRVTQRSSWIVSLCAEKHPELIHPYLSKMVARMQEPGVHDAVRRNVLRILQDIEIPKNLLGTVATVCFDYLVSADAPIAVKVFCMTVLGNITRSEPDLRKELQLVIERQLPYAGAGFRSRAKRVLRMIAMEKTINQNV